ncbi:hypothetical protein ES708_02285 [subsurface metagenome]
MDNINSVMLQQIREIDQRDEVQIMSELAGETLQEYYYEVVRFDRRQKRQIRKVKLSWAGVREVARNRGNIILDYPVITETEKDWRVVVKATDLVRNFTVFGGCHQTKKMKVSTTDEATGEIKNGKFIDDDYAFEKAISKAQRNALDKCIPADYMAKAIDRLLRASGRPPVNQLAKPRKGKKEGKLAAPPQIKAGDEWDKIVKEAVPDYPHLEPIIWNLCKLQPKQMYQQLGVSSRSDMTIPAWEAFLQLKEVLRKQPEPETPSE